jgi:hypothetical protein
VELVNYDSLNGWTWTVRSSHTSAELTGRKY